MYVVMVVVMVVVAIVMAIVIVIALVVVCALYDKIKNDSHMCYSHNGYVKKYKTATMLIQ